MPNRSKDQKRSHKDLRISDDFYHQLIESLEDYAVFTTDKEGFITSWNTGAEKILGYSEDEIIGQDAVIFYTPEDRLKKAHEKEKNLALKNGRAVDERWHVRKDGGWFWGSGLMFPLKNEAGKVQGFTKVSRNLTERKRAEDTIEKSEELFRNAFTHAGVGVAVTDANGKYLYVNPKLEEISGYSLTELSRLTLDKLIHPDDLNESVRLISELQKGRIPGFILENRYICKDGSVKWVRKSVSLFKEADVRGQSMIGIVENITDRRIAEEILRESEERFRNLADTAPMYLAMADETGSAIYFNKPWLKFVGKTLEEMLGFGWLDTLHPDDAPKFEREFKHAFQNQISINEQYRFKRADGEYRWMLAVGAPRLTPEGKFIGYYGTYTDFHEIKQALHQRDEFLGLASHELKTPVTSIKAYGQYLQKWFQKKGNDEAVRLLGKMDGQINKLSSLIGDLLDVTKIESGKLQFSEEYYSLNDLIEEVTEELQRTMERHKLKLKLSSDIQLFGDRDRTGQVLVNLLTNAMKYSPNETTITITSKQDENNGIVCIKDRGVGIPKEKLNRVFERFFRVHDSANDSHGGLGLGLYISNEIIKRQGGTMTVKSTEGKGSESCFSLPTVERHSS